MSETQLSPEALQEIEAVVGRDAMTMDGRHCHVKPASASEVSQIAALVATHKITLVPVGKGGHSSPSDDLRPQIFLNLERLHHILHLDEQSLIVHVQAGMTGSALEKVLNTRDLTLGDFPIEALNSSIGGLLSVRTPGKSTRRHGTFEDTVLGISAVLSGGKNLRTRVAPRRASGPDLARVICGSEGSLGIITSAELRIHKRPESRLLAAYKIPSFSDALTAVRMALREEASPAALRIYDGAQCLSHLNEQCVAGEVLMVAATVGPTSLAACDRNLISSAVEAVGGRPANGELAAVWWKRRSELGQSLDAQSGEAQSLDTQSSDTTIPAINLEVSATPTMLAPVYQAIIDACIAAGLSASAHASRFNSDGGVLFFTLSDQHGALVANSSDAMDGVKTAAESAGAYLIERVNPSLSQYFESLRDALDLPRHLNPGVLRSSK
ncbi:MAG: FAD-binding oxidoreductase [Kofleriaceae bacterium]|nr:FAD-binding oxidoreductase [Kofleriaceae bacterium]